MIIVITGTCAVGKSTVASLLSKEIKGKTIVIPVDCERFSRLNPHSYKQTYLSNLFCAKQARIYESKGYTVIVEGNYIFRNLKSLYGKNTKYVHLDADFITIYRRHKNRVKKLPFSMILGSWLANKLLFRRSLSTCDRTSHDVVQIIIRQFFKL